MVNLLEELKPGKFVMNKDYGTEQYMVLYLIKMEMYYYKKEVLIKSYGQTCGTLQLGDMY